MLLTKDILTIVVIYIKYYNNLHRKEITIAKSTLTVRTIINNKVSGKYIFYRDNRLCRIIYYINGFQQGVTHISNSSKNGVISYRLNYFIN